MKIINTIEDLANINIASFKHCEVFMVNDNKVMFVNTVGTLRVWLKAIKGIKTAMLRSFYYACNRMSMATRPDAQCLTDYRTYPVSAEESKGINHIIVISNKYDSFTKSDQLALTGILQHEIGHILGDHLDDSQDEVVKCNGLKQMKNDSKELEADACISCNNRYNVVLAFTRLLNNPEVEVYDRDFMKKRISILNS